MFPGPLSFAVLDRCRTHYSGYLRHDVAREGGPSVGGLADRRAVLVTAVLLFSGFIMLYSASSPFSLRHYGSDTSMLIRQLMAAGVGMLALIVLERWDYHHLALLNDVFLIGGILLTLLTNTSPIGLSSGTTGSYWVHLRSSRLRRSSSHSLCLWPTP